MKPQLQLEPPPQTLISPLLELRDYYARLVEEYENLYNQARSQLNNVEGLLSSWSSLSEANNKLLTAEVVNEILSASQKDLLLSPSSHGVATSDRKLEEYPDSEQQDSEELETDSSASITTNTDESSVKDSTPQSKDNSLNNVDIPMLSEYESLTRMEAIKKLLEQHLGTVCHIDFIVRSLYGELKPHVFRVVKGRVQSSLTQGRERQAWFGMPNEPGCYTLDLSLVNANQTNSKTGKNKKKPLIVPKTSVIPMLKAFEGQFLIDALTTFFRQNPGKVFGVAEIIAALYGELDAEEVREVKSKVLNELSRGYRTGRFSRMPDTVGFYTWDTKLIRKTNSG
ncbi:hypothetical protein IQ259_07340 [Fortiea sp. LEGE XX443]|uniref:hypothetical protein n=1 Tax=Fortiea sp. LEGE XX443 TaxID=1828611 RepID=UPI001881D958|nr:hypothetical protein [Fortiea sp. LEGE XX443]MBE9004852.1 hypothetical protein [Fortiea sp. LEGE XX443]